MIDFGEYFLNEAQRERKKREEKKILSKEKSRLKRLDRLKEFEPPDEFGAGNDGEDEDIDDEAADGEAPAKAMSFGVGMYRRKGSGEGMEADTESVEVSTRYSNEAEEGQYDEGASKPHGRRSEKTSKKSKKRDGLEAFDRPIDGLESKTHEGNANKRKRSK